MNGGLRVLTDAEIAARPEGVQLTRTVWQVIERELEAGLITPAMAFDALLSGVATLHVCIVRSGQSPGALPEALRSLAAMVESGSLVAEREAAGRA